MLTLPLKRPGLFHKLLRIRRQIYRPICRLNAEILKSNEPLPFEEMKNAAFSPISPDTNWGRKLDCAWLRITGRIPEDTEDAVILLGIRGEGLVYSANGDILDSASTVWQMGDLPHSAGHYRPISTGSFAPGEQIEVYADIAYNGFLLYGWGNARYHDACVALRNTEAYAYYYDFLTLTVLTEATEDTALAATLHRALQRSFRSFSAGDIRGAREILAPHLQASSQSTFTYSAIGHGHLDMAWLWPLRETHRKSARTHVKALNTIDQYPGYIFGTSQPQQLFWMKQEHPALYRRFQQAVAGGRIELQGAFWVECDSNLPGGESLVRQAVYGRRFLSEEFGRAPEDMRLCWLPDAFGYSGNLPQILKKSGMDWFSTIKLAWNKVNNFPYRTFYWQGIDGSTVLVHMPPEGDYNSRGAADGLLKGIKQNPEKELNTALLVYGSGDGGGGPQEVHLEVTRREHSLYGLPRVEYATADSFFRRLEQLNIPHRHTGELYLETHQGTYTAQSRIKYYNRLIERKLHEVEALAVISGTACRSLLRAHWQDVLLHQFHDILPGSSIERVNTEAVETYRRIEEALDAYRLSLTDRLPASERLSALNTTSFYRKEYISAQGAWYHAEVAPYAAANLEPVSDFPQLGYTADTMTNGILTLRFDASGEIVSCRDAQENELAGQGLNRLVLHRDPYQFPFDAWDIDQRYYKKRPKKLRVSRMEIAIDGPTVVRQHIYQSRGLTMVQKVILTADSDVVRFDTTVNWQQNRHMLRAEFYPSHYGKEVQCEIQFGHIARFTTENNPVEAAQFEICAHKWVATQDERGGFALLNDCKYGHRIKNGLISLNLLRSSTFPDKTAERGEHCFTYAFCPFEKDRLDKVILEAYRLNNPLLTANGAAIDSFARTDNPAVVIETIKPAESDSGIVLRLYESLGQATHTSLHLGKPFSKASETDLLENKLAPADLSALRFGPFEIKTILLEE